MTVSHMTFEAIEMLPKSLGCKNLKVWKCISSGIKLNKLRGLSENAVGVSRPSSVGLYFLVCTSPSSIPYGMKFLREFIFAGCGKIAKIKTRKHFMPYGSS